MKFSRKKGIILGLAILTLIISWVAYARTTSFRLKTVLIEAQFPSGSKEKSGLANALRLIAGLSLPKFRSDATIVKELASFGEPAIPQLAETLRTEPKDTPRSNAAASALLELRAASVDALKTLMLDRSNTRDVRLFAALLIRNITAVHHVDLKGTSAVPALLTLMEDEDATMRYAGVHALVVIDPALAVERGLPIVRKGPPHKDDLERWYWFNTLFLIGPANAETRELMEKELAQGHYVERYAQWARTHKVGEVYH